MRRTERCHQLVSISALPNCPTQELSDEEAGLADRSKVARNASRPRTRKRRRPAPAMPATPYEVRTKVCRILEQRCACGGQCLKQLRGRAEEVSAIRLQLRSLDKRDADQKAGLSFCSWPGFLIFRRFLMYPCGRYTRCYNKPSPARARRPRRCFRAFLVCPSASVPSGDCWELEPPASAEYGGP